MEMVIGAKMTGQILQDALIQLPVDACQLLSEQVTSHTQLGSRAARIVS